MATAADRGWGSPGTPGTASAVVYRKQHIVTIDVGGIRLSVRREVAPLFAGFIVDITKLGYDLAARADDWGYVCRPVRGYEEKYAQTRDPRYLSNHSWGLAVDLNAVDHPMGQRHTGVPAFVVEASRKWGLSWGGDYVNRPDEMHFEYLGTPQEAARLVESLASHPSPNLEDLMRDERIIVVPAPDDDGRQLVNADKEGHGLGLFSKFSSVEVCASREGKLTRLYVEPFAYIDALVLAVANPDGSAAQSGREARIVIEHR